MNQLRKAATRERRVPMFWWCGMALVMGGALYILIRPHSPTAATLTVILLAGAWAAPVLALVSLMAPRRALSPPPGPGQGGYAAWKRQVRLLGRVLLYYGDIPELPPDIRGLLRRAREDLHDTLRAHPLRDDLERVCGRIRTETLPAVKAWLWAEFGPRIRESAREAERHMEACADDNERLRLMQEAVENAAAQMTRYVMPRMLERERLACAHDCTWLAATAVAREGRRISPMELAAMFVVVWSDFSEPWQPAEVIRRVFRRELGGAGGETAAAENAAPGSEAAETAAASAGPADDGIVIRNGKRYRRVRVRRRSSRRHHRRHLGPSALDILLSFGQWVRYSVRSWLLTR